MKKQWITVSAVALMGVSIAGCSAVFDGLNDAISPVDTVSDVYAISGLSSAALLSNSGATPLAVKTEETSSIATLSANAENSVVSTLSNEINDEELAIINQYLGTFESLLEGDGALSSVVGESDRVDYTTKITVTTKGIDGTVSSYVMYYNETEIVPEEEIEDDEEVIIPDTQEPVSQELRMGDGRDFGWKFREKDGIQTRGFDEFDGVSSTLDGVLVVGSGETAVEYAVTGIKVVDGDKMTSRFISMIDNWNFVQVTQRVEDGKQVFKYTVVEDAHIVSRSEITVTNEEDNVSVRLRFIDGTSFNQYTFKKEIEATETVIKIHYNTLQSNGVIRVVVTTDEVSGEPIYQYFFAESNRRWDHSRLPWGRGDHTPESNQPDVTPSVDSGETV